MWFVLFTIQFGCEFRNESGLIKVTTGVVHQLLEVRGADLYIA